MSAKIAENVEVNKVELQFDSSKTEQNGLDKAFAACGMFEKMSNWAELESEISKNANEAMQTTLTSYGKELVPLNVLSEQFVDMIVETTQLLSFLPSSHGTNMAKSEKVPVMGEAPFMQGNSEWDGSDTSIPVGNTKVQTAEVSLTQVPLIVNVPISKRLLNFSIIDVQKVITDKVVLSGSKTIESAIINADAETGATGNVNSDDQAPATTFAATGGANDHRLVFDHGIRELAINNSLTHDCGALDRADFTSIENFLGNLFGDRSLWITNRKTYNKAISLAEFTNANQRGQVSTLNGNAVTNIDGADLYISVHVPLTEADGKASKTAANNVKGQLLLVDRPSVQYGWGQPSELDIVKIPGKGIQVIHTMEFAFTIVNQKAGQTDASVAAGINITV